jgi:hypothetical protein
LHILEQWVKLKGNQHCSFFSLNVKYLFNTHLAGSWVVAASFCFWGREGPDAYHWNEPLFIQPTSVVNHQQI